MIVHILGHGRFRVDDSHRADFDDLEDQLLLAADAHDDDGFELVLGQLRAIAHELGTATSKHEAADLTLPTTNLAVPETLTLLHCEAAAPRTRR
ncbi:PspA-associated protein PspAA [Nocardia pseudobrasiliensis]|uniref:PspA-associated domain-containing protein n=1 Tax=Nocardia pseudobrasiliensis TaxID=45979 RepID=A0A370IFP6_9NOCA|nr:hypothetical protein [Nocardia pseudobrasiliensis]RDI68284.1 hypothetical protein DFR76_102685 [Nocardia pseudobrasiliensis]